MTEDKKIKIIDFGLAIQILSDTDEEEASFCGTPNYISPETILKK